MITFPQLKRHAIMTVLFVVLFSFTINGVLAEDSKSTVTATRHVTLSKGSNIPTILNYEEHDLGIKMNYPSNWIKLEDYLRFHTVATFLLVHTDKLDRTNTTLAEVDLRIYPELKNETLTTLSANQTKTQNDVILNSYRPSSQILMLRVLNPNYHSVELEEWMQIPTKHLIFEIVYISDEQFYSKYLPIVSRMMDSIDISS